LYPAGADSVPSCDHPFCVAGGTSATYSAPLDTFRDFNTNSSGGGLSGRDIELGLVGVSGRPVRRETASDTEDCQHEGEDQEQFL